MSDSPREILERWELCGGTWKVTSLSPDRAEIELCTCYGEPVDELRSTEPAFLAEIAERIRKRPS
jgi:hypothetical protein